MINYFNFEKDNSLKDNLCQNFERIANTRYTYDSNSIFQIKMEKINPVIQNLDIFFFFF